MAKKSDIRSYCNPFPPRFTKDAQIDRLSGEPYVEDRKGSVIEALIRSLRAGGVVEVIEMGLLAPIKAKPAARRKALADLVSRIAAKGGVIREVNTGWQSDKQMPQMLVRATEFIATSGRAGTRRGKRGNPVELAPEQFERAKMIWRSREHTNDRQRLDAIKAAIGRELKRSWCWNEFGSPSGVRRKRHTG